MSLLPTFKASQLVSRLQELIEQHGDLPVYADDADTSWRLPIGILFKPVVPIEGWPDRFEIKTTYDNKQPKGAVDGT
jgi:hypothetical protein